MTDVVPVSAARIPSTLHSTISGMESLTQDDFITPRWSIVQPTSKKDGADDHAGQFLRNLDGEFRPFLECVILKVSPSRLKWPADIAVGRPECFSRDGVHGSVYGACRTCGFNVFANPQLMAKVKAKTVRNGEKCNSGFDYLIIDDLELQTVALMGAMGTSVAPVRIMNSRFNSLRCPPRAALTRFSLKRVVNDQGKFYVLEPVIVRRLTAEERVPWDEMFNIYNNANVVDIETTTDDVSDVDEPLPF